MKDEDYKQLEELLINMDRIKYEGDYEEANGILLIIEKLINILE